jgi:hypothetical protein
MLEQLLATEHLEPDQRRYDSEHQWVSHTERQRGPRSPRQGLQAPVRGIGPPGGGDGLRSSACRQGCQTRGFRLSSTH